ncbi:MAG: BolA family protein [Pseudomonadota bacterium]|nr:BolA family protein [Pseudomonadota bacterium]
MSMETIIRQKLTEAFAPVLLEVKNESHLHAHHASSPGTGESHFRVTIVSGRFAGQSRVNRHRLVNETLAAELKGGVHALAIKASAPGE